MRIRQKTNLLKRMLPSLGIILIVGVLLAPILMTVIPATASADNSGEGKFEYSDTKASNVYELRDGTTQKYTRSTGGQGVYTGGNADGFDGCSAFLQTNSHKYDGDTKAQWYAVCTGGRQQTPSQPGQKTISIAPQKNYVGKWVDHNHITVDGVTYYDKGTDNNLNFVAVNQSNDCPANVIKGFHGNGGGDIANAGGGATLTVNEPFSSTNGKCTSKDVPISFDNTQNFLRFFQWIDSGTIQTTDGKVTFVKGDNGKFVDNNSTCKSTFEPDGDLQHGTLVISYDGDNPFGSGYLSKIDNVDFNDKGGCQVSKPINGLNLADVDAAKKAAGTGDINGAAGANPNDDAEIGCEFNVNPLSWIVCPVIDMMSAAVKLTDNLITQEMVLPANDIFCANSSGNKGSCDAYYIAWTSFRNIALGLLAIVGLIVIIAQAAGMEILDAYTIRKTLPRILVAAIAITLSWPLMSFAVTLSNNLGFGVRDLITAPFHAFDNTATFSSQGGAIIAGFGAFVLGGIAIVASLGILLSYVATAGIAVLIAIMVLVVRQIVIIAFIIISPIAILAYVLPNTQRIFKVWWESFSKALLMFPLIVAFIATGRVFAAVTLSNSQSLLSQITAFVAYFGPYFAIPLTFRMSGALMSGVGNAINQRGQPAFGRLSQYRKDKGTRQLKKARAKQLFDENFGRFKNPFTGKQTGIARMANRLAMEATDQDELLGWRAGKERDVTNPLTGKKWGGVWGTRKGSRKMQDMLDDQAIMQSQKGLQEINEKVGGAGLHYEAFRGMSGQHQDYKGVDANGVAIKQRLADAGFVNKSTGEAIVPRSEQDFKNMGEILQESSDDKERLGGDDMLEHRGTLASIKDGEGMEYADTQIMGAIGQAAAGRAEPGAAANIGNSVSARLGSGVAQRTMKAVQHASSRTERPDLRDGHGIIKTKEGKYESAYSEKNYKGPTAVGSVISIKGSAWSGAKAEAVTAAARTIKHIATGGTGNAVQQRSVQDMIKYGIQNPYNDAGQRQAWMKIAKESGLSELADLPPMETTDYDQLVMNMPDPDPAPTPAPPVG